MPVYTGMTRCGAPLDKIVEIAGRMHDAHDLDAIVDQPIEDEIGSVRKRAQIRFQFRAGAANARAACKQFAFRVDSANKILSRRGIVAMDVEKDVDEVLLCLWMAFEGWHGYSAA